MKDHRATAQTSGDPMAAAAATVHAADAARPAASQAGAAPRARAARPPQQGWLEALQSIYRELPGLLSVRIELLSLELRRAGTALAQIIALLVAAAILGVTAWLALWVGIGVGLVELGLHWSLSLLLVLALNAGFAVLAIACLRGLLPLLRLPATRRHLMPGRLTGQDAAAAAAAPAAAAAAPSPLAGQPG